MKIDNDIRRLRRKKIKAALVRSGGSVRHAAASLGWRGLAVGPELHLAWNLALPVHHGDEICHSL